MTKRNKIKKGELIHRLSIGSVDEAINILKSAGTVDEDLFEKAKHQDGDMHPNGKWVWVASANGGKGDWRTAGGRTHKKHQAGAASGSTTSGTSTSTSGGNAKTSSGMPSYTLTAIGAFKGDKRTMRDYIMKKHANIATNIREIDGGYEIEFDRNDFYEGGDDNKRMMNMDIISIITDFQSHGYQVDNPKKAVLTVVKKQSSKATVAPKTDKERLDLQQEYATLSQLVKKPSTSAANKKNFQDRMKEIEGMGLQVVKGKFQWKDTEKAAVVSQPNRSTSKLTPNQQSHLDKLIDSYKIFSSDYSDPSKMSINITPKGNWELVYDGKEVGIINRSRNIMDQKTLESAGIKFDDGTTPKQTSSGVSKGKKVLMDNLQTDHLKNAPEGHTITVEKPGNNQGVYQKYVKLADGYWKNPITNQRYTNAQMKQRLEGLHKNLYGVDLGGLTESKPKEQKKLRPVGTGTNGPERRRKK